MKDSPVTWNVPSNESPVDPTGHPHWSSKFGDVQVQDFAIQISTKENFENTKAHWWVRWQYRMSSLIGGISYNWVYYQQRLLKEILPLTSHADKMQSHPFCTISQHNI